MSLATQTVNFLAGDDRFAGKDFLIHTDETNVEEIDPQLQAELNFRLDLLRLSAGAEEQATGEREAQTSAIEALVESLAKQN